MTNLSYRIFANFSAILENLDNALFRKVPKTVILADSWQKWAQMSTFGQI